MCSWTLPCVLSLVPSVLHLSHGFQCSPTLNRQPYEGRLPLTSWCRKLSNMTVGHCPDILNPPFLRLTFSKPLDLQPVDNQSWWMHNWKLAQVVNSHLVSDPTIRQPGFDLPRQQCLCWTVFARNRDTAVHVEGNGDLQTLMCVLVGRPRRCPTLSTRILSPDKTEWRHYSCHAQLCFLKFSFNFLSLARSRRSLVEY